LKYCLYQVDSDDAGDAIGHNAHQSPTPNLAGAELARAGGLPFDGNGGCKTAIASKLGSYGIGAFLETSVIFKT